MGDHPLYAAVYDRVLARAEVAGLAARRRRLLSSARGRVLEIGGGTGLNLAHYDRFSSLTILEPDGAMRRRLLERVARAGGQVEVHEAGIDDAVLEPGTFDTVVATLVLCTVPDLTAALARIRDLLAPEGRFLFLEHELATGWTARAQAVATPLWRRVVPGCHLDRDVTGAIRAAGMTVVEVDHFELRALSPLARFVVAGVARAKIAGHG